MAGVGHFRIDPEELHRLAGTFDQAADHLASVVSRFAASAQPHGDAFGPLPQARAAHARYSGKAHEAHAALHAVRQAFGRSLAGGLRTNAANYVRADQDSMVP